jgi:hypothetical protein
VLEAIKSRGTTEQSTRRDQHAAVLADVKAEPSVGRCAASLDIVCARRRPQSAVGAEESLRRGRTKESRVGCGWAQAWPARANERALALAEGQKK